jgi:hypothetical protein
MTMSALLYLAAVPPAVAELHRMGYPDYFRVGLGAAKLLGVAAILFLRSGSTLREWAFAGFTFDLIAGAISHRAVGEPVFMSLPSLAALGLALVSRDLSRRAAE